MPMLRVARQESWTLGPRVVRAETWALRGVPSKSWVPCGARPELAKQATEVLHRAW
jgi:hypothetical protein